MTSKRCSKCGEDKPLELFVAGKKYKSGYGAECKECHRLRGVGYKRKPLTAEQKAARDRRYAQWKQSGAEAKSAIAKAKQKWKDTNRILVRIRNSEYKKQNAAKILADTRLRQARKLKATPPWVDMLAIREVYDLAQEFRDAGFNVHVDHIIPLRGMTVSGLHVHQNLRVCLASVNAAKGNKLLEYHL